MWNSLLTQIQTQPWLQALLTGSGLCALFWLIDHVGAHAMVRYIPIGTPVYRRNLTGILRRVLLLCAAGLFFGEKSWRMVKSSLDIRQRRQ